MGKILVIMLIAIAASAAIASRDVRSPGGRGWQGSSFGGGPPSGIARSSSGGWSGSGGGLGRSASSGWDETSFGSRARSRSGIGNWSPTSNGNAWPQSGYTSNGGYGGNTFRSSPGWNDRFADSTVIESLDSSNGCDQPGLGFRSNNGWQSSAW